MPSDERTSAVLEALTAPRDRFRSALATTVDSVRALLEDARSRAEGHLDGLAAEFGALGPTYLDIDRLATVVNAKPAADPATLAVVERAHESLGVLAARPDLGLAVDVPPGGSLADTVAAALGDTGRAIGAARMVRLAREGRYQPAEHDRFLEAYPFGLWSQDERHLAPPLVVNLAGADLRPSALVEYLDGDMKFVLIVAAPATPAPLVRLITPGTFVAQSDDPAVVGRLAAWSGPGVVAVLPEGAAEFVHDPAGGERLADRLAVTQVPDGEPVRRVGPFSAAQQRDELKQLASLAASSGPGPSAAEPAGAKADDPVGKLAAWLLRQAEEPGDGQGRSRGD